jgi:L-ascorbate metabolism protein UlaG (beta-lactamase superfamily)
MKRRQLMGYAGTGLATALFSNFAAHLPVHAQSTGVSVQWLGHTCFLFTGSGLKILVNPFRPLGCTARYRPPKVAADLVLISSQLLDEGAVDNLPGNPKIIYKPGSYEFKGIKFQGISTDHDRKGGKQFGTNTVWKWTQGGVNILHLGGIAAPISIEQKILMGRPDVVFIPVGGSEKAYNAEEATQAIKVLNPRLVIPTHYLTQAADSQTCTLTKLDDFLKLNPGIKARQNNNESVNITAQILPENTEFQILSYKF